ncbi:MAG: peroxiredoxin [Gammaproteobacteria bacterium HGW-Gammaproteobacteria-3]|nr:MAG: peroxiredoxin [Gammaproteobacteria bacterium HGW-Gammaproteobacteria-3]
MKKLILACLLLTIGVANAALQEGDVAPEFKTRASLAGKDFDWSLQESLKKGPVVLYFYPSAYTGGCNIQAHDFAVKHDRFVAAGASVVGISLDSIERLNEFSADPDYCAGKFPVASDPEGRIAQSFELSIREAQPGRKDSRGVEIDHGFAERTTFIITPDGKVAATIGGLSPSENVQAALDAVQKLTKGN